jgi:hypothetical protein
MRVPADYRYGLVLLQVAVAVLFAVLVPDGQGSRAIVAAILGLALVGIVITSHLSIRFRRLDAGLILLAVVVIGGLTSAGAITHPWVPSALAAALVTLMIIELTRGMFDLMRTSGVTAQAIAGGLAIYLLLGLWFAMVIGVLADVGSSPYFVGGTNGDMSDHVYFSFTTLTTTGFGDPVAATQPGKALAVMEMLIGQIYLVTVIALLVSRARADRNRAQA